MWSCDVVQIQYSSFYSDSGKSSKSVSKYKNHQKFMKILGASYENDLLVSRLTPINPWFLLLRKPPEPKRYLGAISSKVYAIYNIYIFNFNLFQGFQMKDLLYITGVTQIEVNELL